MLPWDRARSSLQSENLGRCVLKQVERSTKTPPAMHTNLQTCHPRREASGAWVSWRFVWAHRARCVGKLPCRSPQAALQAASTCGDGDIAPGCALYGHANRQQYRGSSCTRLSALCIKPAGDDPAIPSTRVSRAKPTRSLWRLETLRDGSSAHSNSRALARSGPSKASGPRMPQAPGRPSQRADRTVPVEEDVQPNGRDVHGPRGQTATGMAREPAPSTTQPRMRRQGP